MDFRKEYREFYREIYIFHEKYSFEDKSDSDWGNILSEYEILVKKYNNHFSKTLLLEILLEIEQVAEKRKEW